MSDPVELATWDEVNRFRSAYDAWNNHKFETTAFTPIALGILPHLFALIDQMATLLHDARQEPGYTLGRAEKQREVLELIAGEKDEAEVEADQANDFIWRQMSQGYADAMESVHQKIASRGEPAWTPPPAVLREENGRLRAALQRILDTPAARHEHDPRGLAPLWDALAAAHQLMPDAPNPQ